MTPMALPPSLPSAAITRVPPPTPDPQLPRFSVGAAVAGMLAVSPFLAIVALIATDSIADVSDDTVGALMGVTAAAALIGFVWSIVTVVRLGRAPRESRPHGRWLAALAIPVSLVSSMLGSLIAVASTISFSRGRQLRERGRPIFAPLVNERSEGDGWLEANDDVDEDALDTAAALVEVELRPVADAWREAGKTEHASVAAFAKLAAELVALGAPSRLIEDAHRDALDEIRHARLCFSLARSLDGRLLEPGPLPHANLGPSMLRFSRTASLAHLAVESLIDGALNEGTSARAVAKLARRVTNARVRHVLLAIARDEGRHAAHGWHVLEWCVREGGDPVRAAIRGALRALPTKMGSSLVAEGDDARWEVWGIPGRDVTEESFAEVRASLMARAQALVDGNATNANDVVAA